MKQKIVILGSTGSIGKQTLDIIKNNKQIFNVVLLSTNKNIKEISKQIKIFKPKFVINKLNFLIITIVLKKFFIKRLIM